MTRNEMVNAVLAVLLEAQERVSYRDTDWNPEAHVQLTLTIAEIRELERLKDALAQSPRC